MEWSRRDDAVEPVRGHSMIEEERRTATSLLAHGTLACPACDAPVAPAERVNVLAPLTCPYCDHVALVKDFLSLAAPTRPAHVDVRVVNRFARH
jgi:DNA-directed RNA polymerase subunit RPC12/RpoP